MKNLLFLVFCAAAMWSCSGKKTVAKTETPAAASKTPANNQSDGSIEAFLKKFDQAMISHDKVTMLALMDRDYKKDRHDGFYKGNTDAFLDKFFCNYRTDGQGFKCIKFADIEAFKRIEIMPNDVNYTVVYHIAQKEINVKCDWLVMVRKEAGKTVYGFYGPVE
jgi:hypothetical protein